MVHKPKATEQAGLPRFDSVNPDDDNETCSYKPPLDTKPSVELPDMNVVNQIMKTSDEENLDSMLNLMQEMKRVQEINKNTPGITDEQRRKNAADMMVKLQ